MRLYAYHSLAADRLLELQPQAQLNNARLLGALDLSKERAR
jgi:hypothetical protein